MLLREPFSATNRSSPMNQCTRSHGILFRQESLPSSWYSFFGLEPPVRQIAIRPGLAAIRAITRSAAACASASASSATISSGWPSVVITNISASFARRA
jgi:hypothetical protein